MKHTLKPILTALVMLGAIFMPTHGTAAVTQQKTLSKLTQNSCGIVHSDCSANAGAFKRFESFSTASEKDIFVSRNAGFKGQSVNKRRAAMIQSILTIRTARQRGEAAQFEDQELIAFVEFLEVQTAAEAPIEAPLPAGIWVMMLGLVGLGAAARAKTKNA